MRTATATFGAAFFIFYAATIAIGLWFVYLLYKIADYVNAWPFN